MNNINYNNNLSDSILKCLLRQSSKNNKFKFWLRRRNTNERLDNGYCYNGK